MLGTSMSFYYNKDCMIVEFAKYVISDELALSHGESDAYEYFNRTALPPALRIVSRNTLKRRTQTAFHLYRSHMIEMFRTFNSRIILTTYTWTSCFGVPFMCVTTH